MSAIMTLRDDFAAKAMVALIENSASSAAAEKCATEMILNFDPNPIDYRAVVARAAYAMADAMIIERGLK